MTEKDFLSTLELSVRAANTLRNNEITTPQLFFNLTRDHFIKMKGGGAKTWREIDEVQETLRRHGRRQSVPGQVHDILRALNELLPQLEGTSWFVRQDKRGRYRLARFVKEDFTEGAF